jgi:hypothetical protein
VGTLRRGPAGGQLLGTYQHTETHSYQDEIGHTLAHVLRTVPHGTTHTERHTHTEREKETHTHRQTNTERETHTYIHRYVSTDTHTWLRIAARLTLVPL